MTEPDPAPRKSADQPPRVPCPRCGEPISPYATVCRWCEADLREPRYVTDAGYDHAALAEPAPTKVCRGHEAITVSYAAFGPRAAAFLIDTLVWFVPNMVLSSIAMVVVFGPDIFNLAPGENVLEFYHKLLARPELPRLVLLSNGLGFAIAVLHEWVLTALCGASLGKLAAGLVVVTADGAFRKPATLPALLRAAVKCFLVVFLLFPFSALLLLPAAFHPRRQGLPDMLARTLVIRRPARWTGRG